MAFFPITNILYSLIGMLWYYMYNERSNMSRKALDPRHMIMHNLLAYDLDTIVANIRKMRPNVLGDDSFIFPYSCIHKVENCIYMHQILIHLLDFLTYFLYLIHNCFKTFYILIVSALKINNLEIAGATFNADLQRKPWSIQTLVI